MLKNALSGRTRSPRLRGEGSTERHPGVVGCQRKVYLLTSPQRMQVLCKAATQHSDSTVAHAREVCNFVMSELNFDSCRERGPEESTLLKGGVHLCGGGEVSSHQCCQNPPRLLQVIMKRVFFRSLRGEKDHREWKTPQLDPAPCLSNFKVVLVGTKKAPSIGTVARALSAFECTSLCCVAPRVNISCRSSMNTSKGAQYLIHNAQVCDNLTEALQGTTYSVAFARWISGLRHALSIQPELYTVTL
jgi:hypothetical protein